MAFTKSRSGLWVVAPAVAAGADLSWRLNQSPFGPPNGGWLVAASLFLTTSATGGNRFPALVLVHQGGSIRVPLVTSPISFSETAQLDAFVGAGAYGGWTAASPYVWASPLPRHFFSPADVVQTLTSGLQAGDQYFPVNLFFEPA